MTRHAPRVAIINETLARQFFPNEDPIGKRILVTNGPDVWRQIVGIVADIKQYGVDKETTSQTYEPYRAMSVSIAQRRPAHEGSPAVLPERCGRRSTRSTRISRSVRFSPSRKSWRRQSRGSVSRWCF